jgi:Ca2+-dependent lipid-binding protein
MRFHFKNARDLRNLETLGKSDPYGRVLLSGVEKGRTVTFQNNLNPDWDEIIYVPVHSTREKLVLEVMDQETMNADRTLGMVEIPASDYIKQDENGEYLVHDSKDPHAGALRMHGKGSARGTLNYTAAFYPCLNIADPEEEEEEAAKKSQDGQSPTSPTSPSPVGDHGVATNGKSGHSRVDSTTIRQLAEGEKEQEETNEQKAPPKIRLTPEELIKYESGLIIFKLLDCELSRSNVHVEVVVDDMAFPSYSSSTVQSKKTTLNEIGDCFVRELDFSKITLRLREKGDKSDDKDVAVSRLTGNTLDTLKQCLVGSHTILERYPQILIYR